MENPEITTLFPRLRTEKERPDLERAFDAELKLTKLARDIICPPYYLL